MRHPRRSRRRAPVLCATSCCEWLRLWLRVGVGLGPSSLNSPPLRLRPRRPVGAGLLQPPVLAPLPGPPLPPGRGLRPVSSRPRASGPWRAGLPSTFSRLSCRPPLGLPMPAVLPARDSLAQRPQWVRLLLIRRRLGRWPEAHRAHSWNSRRAALAAGTIAAGWDSSSRASSVSGIPGQHTSDVVSGRASEGPAMTCRPRVTGAPD